MTVYYWFVAFAFIGFAAGLLFMTRGWVEVFAVDVLLTIMGIGINVVLTLAFAAIVGWHTGAVIESLDTEG
jgi:nicotinamide riboside transporter PnuC